MSSNDMFSALLNDPETMQKIAGIASELMGNTSSSNNAVPAPTSPPQQSDATTDLMQRMMPALSMLAQNSQRDLHSNRFQLLCALKPFLSPHTCAQIDHAEHILSMARMTQTAINQILPQLYGKGDGVHV